MGCPSGCHACCDRPARQIETSLAEMLPLARVLWESGEAENVLAAAEAAGDEGPCVLLRAGASPGACSQYAHRPLACRLFGFSTLRDKRGRHQALSCAILRGNPRLGEPELLKLAPDAAAWRSRVADDDPLRGLELEGVNSCLARAIRQEGLLRRLGGS